MTRVLHSEGQPGLMDVMVVGSLAYDSIQTPAAQGERLLGGSATYAGLASAANGASCGLVGVVGEDFRDEDRALLASAGLHLDGVVTAEGRTFHWEGEYSGAMGEASTLNTELNVFEAFDPEVPAAWTAPSVLFCANLHPALQSKVLDQCTPTRLRMLDSMNLWIDIARKLLIDVLRRVDLVVLNDGEVRMLAEDANLVRAAQWLHGELQPGAILVVKRGEHGVLALHESGLLHVPSVPSPGLVDPTGCGDSFAGTLAAHLSKGEGPVGREELRIGLEHAAVVASFTLQGLGVSGLVAMEQNERDQRLSALRALTR